ncbi:unnamed protein product [Zymoseptoria tritici ST99CH_1A5]|uniref:Metallo-beta-lactamase domain-containing protein n=1 Tax=Zymoseptoria tritici ST99CH_1A5 TaxID=1276529 RepID=A0A1Y6LRM0_ZYMTR|nr:unnamed protein product [Zymoseptoria tritici ST99CH_3D1]SMY27037.1 unnamed protein product [Zymoseptoria tritici ST99CH_1A5]
MKHPAKPKSLDAELPPPLPDRSDSKLKPSLHPLYEELTETWQFVIACPITQKAAIIDSHLDNNHASTAISTIAADRALAIVRRHGYTVQNILSTHDDPRYPSAAWYLRCQLMQSQGMAPEITANRSMTALHRVLKRKYSMNGEKSMESDLGGDFADGQEFAIGELKAQVLHLANGSFAFVIGDLVFAGVSDIRYQLRHRHASLIESLRDYRLLTSYDKPPIQKARLIPVMDGDESSKQSRKLVIRYAAQ